MHNLEQVSKIRSLAMWLDRRLTWKEHIEGMEDKCKKVLNIIRCVASKTIYIMLIRSILDYGCIVYGSVANTHLEKLEKIKHRHE